METGVYLFLSLAFGFMIGGIAILRLNVILEAYSDVDPDTISEYSRRKWSQFLGRRSGVYAYWVIASLFLANVVRAVTVFVVERNSLSTSAAIPNVIGVIAFCLIMATIWRGSDIDERVTAVDKALKDD